MSKSLEAHEKFDYYAIGLCFTILGASIQTARFDPNQRVAMALEVGAWALFVISGFKGILRLRMYTHHYYHAENQSLIEETQEAILDSLLEVRTLSAKATKSEDPIAAFGVESLRADLEKKAKRTDELLAKQSNIAEKLDSVAPPGYEAFLLLAIVTLAIARATEPMKMFIRSLL